MHKSDDMAEYMRERRRTRKRKAIDYLGGCCIHCGVTENLDIDHVDPKQKSFDVSTAYALDGPWERLVEELNKCQLLCKPCHIAKTAEDVLPDHGTISRYYHRKQWCRCIACKRVYSEYRKVQRQRLKERIPT